MSPSWDDFFLSCSMSSWQGDRARCRFCDTPLTGRQQLWCSRSCVDEFGRNHWWTNSRRAALKRDEGCTRDRSHRGVMEVNHIEPRNGQGYEWGCWHHLDGLETLCHDCHVATTNEQRRGRKEAAPG